MFLFSVQDKFLKHKGRVLALRAVCDNLLISWGIQRKNSGLFGWGEAIFLEIARTPPDQTRVVPSQVP
jgi:hypothetical protein